MRKLVTIPPAFELLKHNCFGVHLGCFKRPTPDNSSLFCTLRPRQVAQTPIARHVRDVLGVRTRPARLSVSHPQPVPLIPGTFPRARPPFAQRRALPCAPACRLQGCAPRASAAAPGAFKLQHLGLHDAAVCAAALGELRRWYATYDGSIETEFKPIARFWSPTSPRAVIARASRSRKSAGLRELS